MKKSLIFIIAAIAITAFAGCSKSAEDVSGNGTSAPVNDMYEIRQEQVKQYNDSGVFDEFTGTAVLDENDNVCLKLTDETGKIEVVSNLKDETVINYGEEWIVIDKGFWIDMLLNAAIHMNDIDKDGEEELILSEVDTSMGFTTVPCYIVDFQDMDYKIFEPDADVEQLTDMAWIEDEKTDGIDKSELILSDKCDIIYDSESDTVYAQACAAVGSSPETNGEIIAYANLEIICEDGEYKLGDVIKTTYAD